jgi:hypothetical protein
VDGPDPQDVERALRDIAGVASVAVDPGQGGGTLRLVLTPDADADRVGSEVRRRLADSFGLGLDPQPTPAVTHAPRLAVLPGGTAARSGLPFAPVATRFRLLAYGPDAARVEVSVAAAGREATGVAEVPDSTEGLRHGAAEATARAVATLRGDTVSPQVRGVDLAPDGRQVTVRLSGTDASGRPAQGRAGVGDDVRLAVVRAVLEHAARESAPGWWTRPGGPGAAGGGPA